MINYETLQDVELISLCKQDENALAFVFSRYDKMLKSICRSYFLVNGDSDDLLQEAMIGLFKAINTYNGESKFTTYAYRCIKNSVLTAVNRSNCNKNKPLNNFISLSSTDVGDIEKNSIISDLNHNPEDAFIKQETATELINTIKSVLSPLEENVLSLYLSGDSYANIAEKTNKNVKSIDNAIQRIRNKLKVALDKK